MHLAVLLASQVKRVEDVEISEELVGLEKAEDLPVPPNVEPEEVHREALEAWVRRRFERHLHPLVLAEMSQVRH